MTRLVCSRHCASYRDARWLGAGAKPYVCDDCRQEGRTPPAIASYAVEERAAS